MKRWFPFAVENNQKTSKELCLCTLQGQVSRVVQSCLWSHVRQLPGSTERLFPSGGWGPRNQSLEHWPGKSETEHTRLWLVFADIRRLYLCKLPTVFNICGTSKWSCITTIIIIIAFGLCWCVGCLQELSRHSDSGPSSQVVPRCILFSLFQRTDCGARCLYQEWPDFSNLRGFVGQEGYGWIVPILQGFFQHTKLLHTFRGFVYWSGEWNLTGCGHNS